MKRIDNKKHMKWPIGTRIKTISIREGRRPIRIYGNRHRIVRGYKPCSALRSLYEGTKLHSYLANCYSKCQTYGYQVIFGIQRPRYRCIENNEESKWLTHKEIQKLIEKGEAEQH